ncbi:MAG: peptidylprolyl isomerase, partial [Dehalococcoidia bacterium]|nr:peptidylprolyl isomerase [Dehalococcoidia bacterium]
KPLSQPVAKVNDTIFDMDYYIKALELFAQGKDAATLSAATDRVIEAIENSELIRQGATDLGIKTSSDEIDSRLNDLNLPDDEVNRDMVAAGLLGDKLLEDYFDPKLPTACEQAQVQAMFLGSRKVADEVIERLGASDNFTSLAKEFSTEALTKEIGGDLGWLPKDFWDVLLGDLGNSLLKDIAFNLEPGMLSEPTYDESVTKGIGYWLIEVIERDENKGSHTRGILLGSQQEAEKVKAKLEAGEDFATMVQEYSQHSATKELEGDLGWVQKQLGNQAIIEAAFALEPGVLSEPVADESIQTQGGYWLVRVVDKDADRQLEDETRQILKAKAFEDWLTEQREKSSIENYLDKEQKAWAVERVLKDRGQ